MRCEVKLFNRTVFSEIVIARDYEDAKKVALARNPGANIVSVNAGNSNVEHLEVCTGKFQ